MLGGFGAIVKMDGIREVAESRMSVPSKSGRVEGSQQQRETPKE